MTTDKKRNWKGTQIDFDRVDAAADYPDKYFKLSAQTQMILLAILRVSHWPTRYYSKDGTVIDTDAVSQWASVAELEVMQEMDFQECCDAILAALGSVNTSTAIATKGDGSEQVEELDDDYDGTPGSIAPDVVYDGSPQDANRDAALCYSLFVLIDATLNAIASDKEQYREEYTMIAASIISLGAALGIFTAGLSTLVGTVVGAAIPLIAQAYVTTISEDELRDEGAREDLLCLAYDNMGQDPSRASFQAAFTGTGLGEAAEKQRLIMYSVAQHLDTFFGWVRIMNEGVEISENGLLPNACVGCGDCGEWTHYHDLVADGMGDWYPYWVASPGNPLGEYRDSALRETYITSGLGDGFGGAYLAHDIAPTVITQVEFSYDAEEGVHTKGAVYGGRLILKLEGSVVHVGADKPFGIAEHAVWNVPSIECDLIDIEIRCSTTDVPSQAAGGLAAHYDVLICGDGTNPFD